MRGDRGRVLGRVLGPIGALASVAAVVAACAGYRVEVVEAPPVDPFGDDPALGRVCVLRPQTFGAVAQAVHRDNGRVVGATQGGRVFFCYLAEPGRHLLVATTDNDAELEVEVRPAETTFVRLELGMGPDALHAVDQPEARAMLRELDPVVARPVSSEVAPPETAPVPAI